VTVREFYDYMEVRRLNVILRKLANNVDRERGMKTL